MESICCPSIGESLLSESLCQSMQLIMRILTKYKLTPVQCRLDPYVFHMFMSEREQERKILQNLTY